jgi:hypothetical protein
MKSRCAVVIALAFFVSLLLAESAFAQWRGHYVRKRGIFGREVERYHWGGGITPQGATVLGNLITTSGQVANQWVGSGTGTATTGGGEEASAAPQESAELDQAVQDELQRFRNNDQQRYDEAVNVKQELSALLKDLRGSVPKEVLPAAAPRESGALQAPAGVPAPVQAPRKQPASGRLPLPPDAEDSAAPRE